MTQCPNSTDSGCLCPEHHPGVLGRANLHVVTVGPPPVRAPEQNAADRLLRQARVNCAACHGDAPKCQAGTGHPNYRRLNGCTAWTPDGDLKIVAAPAQQPWEPKPARHLRAA